MHTLQKRHSFALICIFVMGCVLLLGAAKKSSGPKKLTSAKKFKNIKVLKTMPADQLMPAMMKISQSLGVRCEFCHVREDFSRDDKKEKATARQMIVMVQRLNKREPVVMNNVTCFMCHHGKATPEKEP